MTLRCRGTAAFLICGAIIMLHLVFHTSYSYFRRLMFQSLPSLPLGLSGGVEVRMQGVSTLLADSPVAERAHLQIILHTKQARQLLAFCKLAVSSTNFVFLVDQAFYPVSHRLSACKHPHPANLCCVLPKQPVARSCSTSEPE